MTEPRQGDAAPEPDGGPAAASGAGGTDAAYRVSLGILSSRTVGLGREVAVAGLFGATPLADVFTASFKAPNLLQNLLGEQALSASFIPVYSKALAHQRQAAARQLAAAVSTLLLVVAAASSLLGVVLAPQIVAVFLPGYLLDAAAVAAGTIEIDRYPLAVQAARLLFPMTGVLVLSAFCLAVLNSHRRFFLPYFAPVLWNLSILVALLGGYFLLGLGEAGRLSSLLNLACTGALVGAVLQLVVQLPTTLRVLGGWPGLRLRAEGLGQVLRQLGPALLGRGVVQLSLYVDTVMSSFLFPGAQAALAWAGRLYSLPISLFGTGFAAAELPELSRLSGAVRDERVRRRLDVALSRLAFLLVGSTAGFIGLGFWIVGALFRRLEFGADDQWLVSVVLAAYSLGLLPAAWSRLLQNAFFSHGDTKTPAVIAAARLVLSVSVGVPLMLTLDRVGLNELPSMTVASSLRLGAVGLALATALVSWAELAFLIRRLRRVYSEVRLPWRRTLQMASVAGLCLLLPLALAGSLLRDLPWILRGALGAGLFAASFAAWAKLRRWPELEGLPWLGRRRG